MATSTCKVPKPRRCVPNLPVRDWLVGTSDGQVLIVEKLTVTELRSKMERDFPGLEWCWEDCVITLP